MSETEGAMAAWLWAIAPELILAAFVVILLPAGSLLPAKRKHVVTWLALGGLGAAAVASVQLLSDPARTVFLDTYVVDPFAIYFKFLAIVGTAFVLLATQGRFRGEPQEGAVAPLLLLTTLGVIGLAASQDLALIALFLQLSTVGSYILIGIVKHDRRASEGALKLFLFSASAGAVMIYGMTLLFGLTGTLRLPEIAANLEHAAPIGAAVSLGLVLVGFGYKVTLAPFHMWAPDAYQGAASPIAGYISVIPKAAGLAVLTRFLLVALPQGYDVAPQLLAVLAAVTMTVGIVFALRQTSVKRLLAYSSIAQGGYLLVAVAAAGRDALAIPALLFYLAAYLFMNLGAFLAIDAIERRTGSDTLDDLSGLGRRLPVASIVLALCLLSLAGFPPFAGFVGKVMLFGAAFGAGWPWLALVMAINTALSLYPYARVLERLYLRSSSGARFARTDRALRLALLLLGAGTALMGIVPQPLLGLADHSSALLSRAPH